jgi:hypothetical protein
VLDGPHPRVMAASRHLRVPLNEQVFVSGSPCVLERRAARSGLFFRRFAQTVACFDKRDSCGQQDARGWDWFSRKRGISEGMLPSEGLSTHRNISTCLTSNSQTDTYNTPTVLQAYV